MTSQDGSVSAACYSLDNCGIVVHIPLEARDLFLLQSIQTSMASTKPSYSKSTSGIVSTG